jgi:type I restriction enzyme S subunit
LFYALLSHSGQKQIARNIQGSAQGGINKTFTRHVIVPFPQEVPEQSEIVTILDAVEKALESRRSESVAARRLKTALMQQLFTKGIPGRHTQFQETKIGRIPAEWELRKGRECFKLGAYGGPPPQNCGQTGECHYLKVDDFNTRGNERVIRTAGVCFPAAGNEDLKPFEPGMIVFAKRGAALLKNRVRFLGAKSLVDPNLMVMTPNQDMVSAAFMRHYLMHFKLGRLCEDAGIPQINNRDLYPKLFPRPKPDEQEQIVAILDAGDELVEATQAECDSLRRLKTSLLQNLLTGKVRVKPEVCHA